MNLECGIGGKTTAPQTGEADIIHMLPVPSNEERAASLRRHPAFLFNPEALERLLATDGDRGQNAVVHPFPTAE